METIYKDEAGKPRLIPSVVAYIDILGYGDYVKSTFAANNGQKELVKLRSVLDEAYRELKMYAKEEIPTTYKVQVRTFTDNLVIGIPMPDWELGDFVFGIDLIISFISSLQAHLAVGGYLVRGAISVGNFYVDEDIVFGEPLMEAYEAEKSLAVFPRVILCESAIEALQKSHGGGYLPDLLIDSDEQVFVDFLDATVMIAYPDGRPFTEFLEGHKNCVLQKLKEFSNKPYIRVKYEWAANYHNLFCDKNPVAIESDFKIPTESLVRPMHPWKVSVTWRSLGSTPQSKTLEWNPFKLNACHFYQLTERFPCHVRSSKNEV